MTERWWKWLAMNGGAPALWAAFGLRPLPAQTAAAPRPVAPQPAGAAPR